MPYTTRIVMHTETQTIKEGTKTVWKTEAKEVKQIDEEHYENVVCKDTLKFFRRLGGSETVTKAYTSAGYMVVKLVSTNPDRSIRKVRSFDFINEYKEA